MSLKIQKPGINWCRRTTPTKGLASGEQEEQEQEEQEQEEQEQEEQEQEEQEEQEQEQEEQKQEQEEQEQEEQEQEAVAVPRLRRHKITTPYWPHITAVDMACCLTKSTDKH
jgi:DNA mismatch repair ATPase MutL